MPPSVRLGRVFDSFAWVEYFRGTQRVRSSRTSWKPGSTSLRKRVSRLTLIATWVGGSL